MLRQFLSMFGNDSEYNKKYIDNWGTYGEWNGRMFANHYSKRNKNRHSKMGYWIRKVYHAQEQQTRYTKNNA